MLEDILKNHVEEEEVDVEVGLRAYDDCIVDEFDCRGEICNAKIMERAITLKYRFENLITYEGCYQCGMDALLAIVDEFNKNPALLEYAPSYKLAEILEYRIFHKMLSAAESGDLADFTSFLYVYYHNYMKMLDTDPEARQKYFTDVKYINEAEAQVRPIKPFSDLEVLVDMIGSAGLHIFAIATERNEERIAVALKKLKQADDKDIVCDLLKIELTSHCLFELHQHGYTHSRLPKYLQIKTLLLKLLLDAKGSNERQKILETVSLPNCLIEGGCENV